MDPADNTVARAAADNERAREIADYDLDGEKALKAT